MNCPHGFPEGRFCTPCERAALDAAREQLVASCPYGGPRSHCTICALGGHRGQVASIRPLHLGAVVVTRGPRTCFVCGVPITGDMPWTPDRTEHALARLRCHAAVTCPRCTMPAAADGYCWRCGLPREEKATMRELSDADLQECIVSGQWRCTVEEVQAAATRLLKEKRAARTFTVTTPDGVDVDLHVGPKPDARCPQCQTSLINELCPMPQCERYLSRPDGYVDPALRAALLLDVLAFVKQLATCAHTDAIEWCPACGARRIFERAWLLSSLAAKAMVLDGRAAGAAERERSRS